ncbi:MAG: FecR domain-containing protein [Acidobacteriota bacterium]
MKPSEKDPEVMLDRTIQEIRGEAADPVEVERAAARVWAQMGQTNTAAEEVQPAADVERIESCADFQALLPAYVSGNLSGSRALLIDDHMRGCVPCRRALRAARTGEVSPAATATGRLVATTSARTRMLRWGIAAAVVLAVGLTQLDFLKSLLPLPAETRAVAASIDGTLFRVADSTAQPLASGHAIGQREMLRTAMNSGAVLRLADGSQVEMRERSELSMEARRDGTTIRLERGSVIVRAAKQRNGHLLVSTPDCVVSVTGTVFAVNQGTKGARVSVLEGEVEVQHASERSVLRPGQQMVTHAGLGQVPIEKEIAWSSEVDLHLTLLRAMADLQRGLEARTEGLRYGSRLLNLAPEDTVLYAAFPNITQTLGEAYDMFQSRIQENPALAGWWKGQAVNSNGRPVVQEMVERVRLLGSFLGDEIVVAVPRSVTHSSDAPVLLAEVRRPAELLAALQQEIARLDATGKLGSVRLVGSAAELSASTGRHASVRGAAGDGLLVYVDSRVMVVSPSAGQLQQILGSQRAVGSNRFVGTAFHARLAEAYSQGASWLFAADLEQLISREVRGKERGADDFLRFSGFNNVRQLIVEQKQIAGHTENRAVLSFNQARTGMAAWLAEPAPMGALEFVSADALAVAAFATKDPSLLVDELFAALAQTDPEGWQELSQFEAEHGVSIRNDIAAPLGGEFLFALDGPILPTPAWKIVVEVYDAAALQRTLEWAVAEFNRQAGLDNRPGVTLGAESHDGRIFYKLVSLETGLEAHYTVADGYLVMAPSRALVLAALQTRASHYSLARSASFRALLPVDGQPNFSGLAYQNFAPVLGALARFVPQTSGKLTAEQSRAIQDIASSTPATLICAYGEKDRIVLASNGQLGLNQGTMVGLGSLMGKISDLNPAAKAGRPVPPATPTVRGKISDLLNPGAGARVEKQRQ